MTIFHPEATETAKALVDLMWPAAMRDNQLLLKLTRDESRGGWNGFNVPSAQKGYIGTINGYEKMSMENEY